MVEGQLFFSNKRWETGLVAKVFRFDFNFKYKNNLQQFPNSIINNQWLGTYDCLCGENMHILIIY